jgi:transcriptional regulator with XRE-family HTH domain
MYGSKIATIRQARGYTQNYIAEKLAMKQTEYYRIEKDKALKIQDGLLQKIAETLGVSIEDIKSPTPVIMNFHLPPPQ